MREPVLITRNRQDLPTAALNILLVGLWILLYRAVFSYLGVIFSREEFRTNQVVLLAVIGLIVSQVRAGRFQPHLALRLQLYQPALILALGSSLAYLAVERLLQINTLSASLFGLASYGLLGLWLRPATWRAGLPAALLLIGALPFGDHMQTFIGYPVRILTAGIVRDGLAAIGVQSVGIDTILVFENGISQVDLPCSGVKSLWTGGLFLLAATWIERKRINLRWIFTAVLFTILLLAANLARVAVLVYVGQVRGWLLAAEMLHVPLGVLGFGGACLAVIGLLRWQGQPGRDEAPDSKQAGELPRPVWLGPVMAGATLIMALLYAPRVQPPAAAAGIEATWRFPGELETEPWPFSPGEQAWIESNGTQAAYRWRFRWGDASGSMLFMISRSWRSQHRPEQCFQVYGLTIQNSQPSLVSPDFPLRVVALGRKNQEQVFSAVYWFQSEGRITEDYGARIWADLGVEQKPWVLVTILFDDARDPGAKDLNELYAGVRTALQLYLEGE